MNGKVRIGVIGGGSVFTPELIQLFVENSEAIGDIEIRLMDIDRKRLEIIGGLGRRIVERSKKPVEVKYVATYEEAIEGADFVLLQFRQGGVDARIEDEKLGLKYRLPFTETVSVCGFATYLRTYPVVEQLAAIIQRLAPDAWVMNFTNPAGMLTETFARLGCKKVVGVCNVSIMVQDALAEKLGVSPEELFMNWRGLNHLTFTDAVYYKGKNVLPEIIEKLEDYPHNIPFPVDLIKALGFIPNNYLQYYYLKDHIVEKLQSQDKVRSQVVKEIEGVLLDLFSKADEVPDELKKRGGYGYSRVVVNLIRGIIQDDRSIRYAIVENGSTLPELPADAFVEVPVVVKADGIRPMKADPLPAVARGLVVTMKEYERLTIEAAQKRDRGLLLKALIIHPLIPSFDVAKALLQDVLEVNSPYLPEFV